MVHQHQRAQQYPVRYPVTPCLPCRVLQAFLVLQACRVLQAFLVFLQRLLQRLQVWSQVLPHRQYLLRLLRPSKLVRAQRLKLASACYTLALIKTA